VILEFDGEPNNAADAYRKAIDLDPDNSTAYGGLGNVLHGLGKLEEARQAFRRARELGKDVPPELLE